MQKFFFHLNLGHTDVIDIEGSDFPSVAEARAEALSTFQEVAGERISKGQPLELLSVRICDEAGDLITEVFADEALRPVIPPQAIRGLISKQTDRYAHSAEPSAARVRMRAATTRAEDPSA
jgi:hypothetical protein